MPLFTELELQQKDYLCGPFHAARVLRECGIAEVDQDLVARHAGTALPPAGVQEVPPGATSRQDYRHELQHVDQADAGTSARGLAAAIAELSRGGLTPVPLSGHWSGRSVEGVLGLDARLIANVRTGRLWGSRPPLEALLQALDGATPEDPPPADWDVGHFVELVALIRGRRGSLVVVRDSYPSFGFDGVHLQPPAALAAALNRGDGRQGGVLAIAAPGGAAEIERVAAELRLQTEFWDN